MSKKLDELDMDYIRELAKSSQKVQDLINEKNKVVYDIERNQNIRFKKFDPAPKPYGDIRIIKKHDKETMSNAVKDEIIEETKSDYNSKIKEALADKALEQDREYIHPIIEDMDKNDLSILIEDGKESYKEKFLENEKSIEESLKYDLDAMEDKYNEHPIYLDFEKNLEDIDKTPSPTDDFE